MEVKTKLYFGPLGVNRICQFVSEKSLHAYNAVFINNEWLAVDASDDIRLSQSMRHLAPPAHPVYFDGVNDALLNLDPDHIISNSVFPLPSLDHVFRKK